MHTMFHIHQNRQCAGGSRCPEAHWDLKISSCGQANQKGRDSPCQYPDKPSNARHTLNPHPPLLYSAFSPTQSPVALLPFLVYYESQKGKLGESIVRKA